MFFFINSLLKSNFLIYAPTKYIKTNWYTENPSVGKNKLPVIKGKILKHMKQHKIIVFILFLSNKSINLFKKGLKT